MPWIGVVTGSLVVLASALILLLPVLINKVANDNLHQENLLDPALIGKDISGPINILMLGVDARTNEVGGKGADSIIIVHINAAHTQAFMVSVPRDSMVGHPAVPGLELPRHLAGQADRRVRPRQPELRLQGPRSPPRTARPAGPAGCSC